MLGNTPYVYRGGQDDVARLFYSKPEQAMVKGISIPGGFGVIPAGTCMGIITESTGKLGKYVPRPTLLPSASAKVYGIAYITVDGVASTAVYMTKEDSYKFAVGDHLAAADTTTYSGSAVDLGAITAIDRTTYGGNALVTVSNNLTTGILMTRAGWVFIQSKTTAPFAATEGILFASVDTGVGENSKGGDGALILGNAMLYTGLLYNYDATVLTELSATASGNLMIMK
jgi:hypothetical protein